MYMTELKKNLLMERQFIQYLKDMTEECFDDPYFPCRKEERWYRQHFLNWLKMFFLYLYMTADKIRLTLFLIGDDKLRAAVSM